MRKDMHVLELGQSTVETLRAPVIFSNSISAEEHGFFASLRRGRLLMRVRHFHNFIAGAFWVNEMGNAAHEMAALEKLEMKVPRRQLEAGSPLFAH